MNERQRPANAFERAKAYKLSKDLAESMIATHRRVLAGDEPAYATLVVFPPREFMNIVKVFPEIDVLVLNYMACNPYPGNPLQKIAVAAQHSWRKRYEAQWRAHKRARAQGKPSPNQVHDLIEHGVAENGSRYGAITYTAQHFGISERQVHRLEHIWQRRSARLAWWQARLNSLTA
jgi:hypothetical protein